MSFAGLETDRLRLRPFLPADRDAYRALNADPLVRRYLGGVLTAAEADAEREEIAAFFTRRGLGMIPVVRKADGAFLGTCGLSYTPWYPDLEIGWRLLPAFWGQGYASEAARAWRDHAFGALGVARLISVADAPNVASHRVMARLGLRFDHEALLEDGGATFAAHIYALDAAGWSAAGNLPGRAGV